MKKILIVGATGFIGSNIAKYLLKERYIVFATCRSSSLFDKCTEFVDKIHWINTDHVKWEEEIKAISPDQLIITAWSGVDANDRNNWDIQISNFCFTKVYFDLAKECQIKKVIAFGSQAEYGRYNFPVNEVTMPNPNDAYGAVKFLCANYLRNILENTDIHWYWLRIFSIFGENDNSNWLIPSVISKLLKNEPINLTLCEQSYNYLYVGDLAYQLIRIIEYPDNKSGIYNICNTKSIQLKELLLQISVILRTSNELLKFGKIPYRSGQNMFIDGSNSKFIENFRINDYSYETLSDGLIKTISFYKRQLQDNSD